MNTYIGIDLGTSSVKLLLVDRNGKILAENTQSSPVLYPQSGWSEQNPADWITAVTAGLHMVLAGQDLSSVRGISFGGQMHGLVVLDKDDTVIRPCILWNDGRTEAQTEYLNTVIGKAQLSALTGNIAFAGFTAPKLLWMQENEPENFSRIDKIMLPKDYVAYVFSGSFSTDVTDASGLLLLDVQARSWSTEMCRICGVSPDQLPALHESYDVIGTLKPEFARKLGLSSDVRIIAGAGDNAAAAIGTGTVRNGDCNISLGTSGTIFLSADHYSADEKNALHSFCHANGKWHLMGVALSAASCRKWWLEDVLGSADYTADEALLADADSDGLFFLPYLCGERSPHNNVNIRSAFLGLSARTTRAQMSRAVIEGVAFALRDSLEIAKQSGVCPASTGLCGGGAKSRIWRQVFADVMNLPVHIPATEQGPAYGAAMLAMTGCGEYRDVFEAVDAIVSIRETLQPDPAKAAYYQHRYEIFRKLYPALKDIKLT